MKYSSAEVPCFAQMKIAHNTVLKMKGFYTPNPFAFAVCLLYYQAVLQYIGLEQGSRLKPWPMGEKKEGQQENSS